MTVMYQDIPDETASGMFRVRGIGNRTRPELLVEQVQSLL